MSANVGDYNTKETPDKDAHWSMFALNIVFIIMLG